MAPNIEAIYSLIDELESFEANCKSELKEIEDYAKSLDAIDQLRNWDFSHYPKSTKKRNSHSTKKY